MSGIAHWGNAEVGNPESTSHQDCPPQLFANNYEDDDNEEIPPAKPRFRRSLPRFGKQTLCQPEITSHRLFLNSGWTCGKVFCGQADTNSSEGTSLEERPHGGRLSVCLSQPCLSVILLLVCGMCFLVQI